MSGYRVCENCDGKFLPDGWKQSLIDSQLCAKCASEFLSSKYGRALMMQESVLVEAWIEIRRKPL